jgi:ABC-2 type transport system permease protein
VRTLEPKDSTVKPDRGGARHPLIELTLSRLREFVREPEAIFWAFGFPILMSIAMAVAFPSREAPPARVGIEAGEAGAALRGTLEKGEGLTIVEIPADAQERALRDGDVDVMVLATEPPTYRFDPARDESRVARLVVDNALKRAAGRPDPWTAREEPVDVPGSRYVDWLIPGIVGLGIMSTGMWGIGFSIVQARLRKVLKLLMASPMRRREYLLGQLFARLMFLAPEVAVPVGFGVFALGMPFRGSIGALTMVSLVGALAFGALGLLVASRVRTFEAISGLMNLLMTPMWIVSGVFFSASNFPEALQPVIQALPLTQMYAVSWEFCRSGPWWCSRWPCGFFDGGDFAFSDGVSTSAIHRVIESHSANTGDSIAILDGPRSLNYRDLNQRANATARRLIGHGFRRGSVAVVKMAPSLELAVTLLAVLKAGGAYTWIDPQDASSWPMGVSIVLGRQDDEQECVAVNLATGAPEYSAPNLPIITRPSDVACVLRDQRGEPAVLIRHEAITSQSSPVPTVARWAAESGALDLWLALMAGSTAVLTVGAVESAAA